MGVLPSTKYRNNERTVSGNVGVENSDVLLNVDTSTVPCIINLQEIPANYWSTLYTLYVKDLSGNASVNNITIVAPSGFKINNEQQIIISLNSASVEISISSNTDYVSVLGYGIVLQGTIPVKNTVYVMKNGNDSTGLVERFDAPFLTINAAINAIRVAYPDIERSPSFRVKVVVEDGTYTEPVIYLYPYIDFDFGNAVLITQITDLFINSVTYSSNPNKDYTTKIFGNSRILNGTGINDTSLFVNVNSRILIQCDTISSDEISAIYMQNGYVKFICNRIYNNRRPEESVVYSHAIAMRQLGGESYPLPNCTLEIYGADIYKTAVPVPEVANFTLGCNIDFGCPDMIGDLDQNLNLFNCRVINDFAEEGDSPDIYSAISCGSYLPVQLGSTLSLYNTVLYSHSGATIYLSGNTSNANLTVYYYNTNCGNTEPLQDIISPYHILKQKIGNLLVSSDVSPKINF
jgi:hypothetical protein